MIKVTYVSITSLVCFFILSASAIAANESPPTIFIFGDSTADVGTNTFILQTQIRADFPHYGIDFPHSRPTGRFSNGKNTADFISNLFGLKNSPPPFMFLLKHKFHFERHLHKGVNFASAGSGILDITGSDQSIVPLSEQIVQFSTVKCNLSEIIGSTATEKMLSKSLFFISIGSNDIFQHFKTNSSMPKQNFIALIISTYAIHITKLYNLGARKFGIISIPSVGCCPSQRLVQKKISGKDGCFYAENDFAYTFYTELNALLGNSSMQLPGFMYSLGNAYNMTIDVINNPSIFGFKSVDTACCGTGDLNAEGPCNATSTFCSDRGSYLFWDRFHPTEKAANLSAQVLYGGPLLYVSPMNFSQLAKA